MSASRYAFANTTPCTLPATPAGYISVIDWILLTATGTAPIVALLNGANLASSGLLTVLNFQMDFAGGFPVWNLNDTEDTPRSQPSISLTGSTGTVGIFVGYHWEKESVVRSNNLDRRGGV